MYVKKSVKRPDGNPGRSLLSHDSVTLIDVEDLKVMPSADDKGVRITDNIVLNAGAYPIEVYLTPGTAELTESSDGDPDQEGFTPQLKFNHPGNSLEVREFKHNCINRRFIGLLRHCDGTVDLFGSPCNPVRLQTSYTGNKDGNTNEITLAQTFKGDGIKTYEGTIPSQNMQRLEYADGVAEMGTLAKGNNVEADADHVITTLASGKVGDVVTIFGSSDDKNATVVKARSNGVAGSNILLKGGDVTLTSGSQITLKAFDTGDGIVWIEQSRYVV